MTGNDSRPMRPHNPWRETWACIVKGHHLRPDAEGVVCTRCGLCWSRYDGTIAEPGPVVRP